MKEEIKTPEELYKRLKTKLEVYYEGDYPKQIKFFDIIASKVLQSDYDLNINEFSLEYNLKEPIYGYEINTYGRKQEVKIGVILETEEIEAEFYIDKEEGNFENFKPIIPVLKAIWKLIAYIQTKYTF